MRALLVEPDPELADAVRAALTLRAPAAGLTHAPTFGEAVTWLARNTADVVAVNPTVDRRDPVRCVARLAASAPVTPLLVLLPPEVEPDRAGFLDAGAVDILPRSVAGAEAAAGTLILLAAQAELKAQLRRAGKTRRDAEQLLSTVLDLTHEGVLVSGPEDQILLVNRAAVQQLDRPAAEMYATKLHDLLGLPETAAAEPQGRLRLERAAPGGGAIDSAPIEGEGGLRLWLLHAGTVPAVGTVPTPGQDFANRLRALMEEQGGFAMAARLRLRPLPVGQPSTQAAVAAIAAARQKLLGQIAARAVDPADAWAVFDGGLVLAVTEPDRVTTVRRMRRLAAFINRELAASTELAEIVAVHGAVGLVPPPSEMGVAEVLTAPVELHGIELLGTDAATRLLDGIAAAEERLGLQTAADLDTLAASARVDLAMVQDRDGAPAALVIPRFEPASAAVVEALRRRAVALPELHLEIDLIVLQLVADQLRDEVDRVSLLPVIEVRYEVLTSLRLAERFIGACAGLTRMEAGCALAIAGVPEGVPAPKLARLAGQTQEACRARALVLETVRVDPAELEAARAALVVIDAALLEPLLPGRPDEIEALVARVHRAHGRILVRRARREFAMLLRDRFDVDLTSAS
ncbi:MAG: PAS domain-containing protein [Geminicoccaceae bacterium]